MAFKSTSHLYPRNVLATCRKHHACHTNENVSDVLHLSRKTTFQTSKCPEMPRLPRKMDIAQKKSTAPYSKRFLRDFLRKRKMKELVCCKGHQMCRTRMTPPQMNTGPQHLPQEPLSVATLFGGKNKRKCESADRCSPCKSWSPLFPDKKGK